MPVDLHRPWDVPDVVEQDVLVRLNDPDRRVVEVLRDPFGRHQHVGIGIAPRCDLLRDGGGHRRLRHLGLLTLTRGTAGGNGTSARERRFLTPTTTPAPGPIPTRPVAATVAPRVVDESRLPEYGIPRW